MKNYGKKFCALAAGAALFFAGCGAAKPTDGSGQEEWAYLPEFVRTGEDWSFSDDVLLWGDAVCGFTEHEDPETLYEPDLKWYSLLDGKTWDVSLDWQRETDPEEGRIMDRRILQFAMGEDGSLYCVAREESEAADAGYLYRFGDEGERILARDISDWLGIGISPFLLTGHQGEVYIACGNTVRQLDGDGNLLDEVSLDSADSRIYGLGYDGDGRMYAVYRTLEPSESFGGYVVISGDTAGYTLAELDFDAGKAVDVCEEFPYEADGIFPGGAGKLLVYDSSAVYEYQVETAAVRRLFQWFDCDVTGNRAKVLGVMEDGRIVATYTDENIDDGGAGLVLLKRTQTTAGQGKEILVLATLSDDSFLQAAAVDFNRNNDEYRVAIRQYRDDDSGRSYEDALADLNGAIVSKDCPDLIDLSGLDLESLASKGVFEDLNPYLEESGVLSREDFLESVLDAYTFGDRLIAIPRRFMVQTAVGGATELDGCTDWTVEQVIAFAQAHPDAELFDRGTKTSVLEYLTRCSQETFIDWTTGECHFDSELFRNVLRFAGSYPDEVDSGVDLSPESDRLADGSLLLSRKTLFQFETVQTDQEIFQGAVRYVGYPTADGSGGHILTGAEQNYGILSRSDHKEGAWKFLESVLTGKTGRFQTGFPSNRSELALEIKKALNSGYVLDENGDPVLDENGEPVDNTSFGGYFDMNTGQMYTFRPPTRDEIDIMLTVLDEVRLAPEENNEIMNMIREESAAYFAGQKTVDDVAAGIQNRVSLYVDENR